MKNRHGQDAKPDTITKVERSGEGYAITGNDMWTTFISDDELDGFVPQVGDFYVLFTTNFSHVHGIIIENRVIRYHTAAQVEKAHKDMIDGFRLDKLERYVKHGDNLKERAQALPKPLRERMDRFAESGGTEFWIEDAGYEMIVLEGAAALLHKVHEIGLIENLIPKSLAENPKCVQEAVDWINEWWDKGYEEQMKIVPDFGAGHSGFTADAATATAIAVLKGRPV